MSKTFDVYISQPDPAQKVWRYMDLSKFLSLLQKRALFFAQWRTLEDQWEGVYNCLSDFDPNTRYGAEMIQALQVLSYTMMVSCWTVAEHESAVLWKSYLTGQDGVAIQSTVNRLLESLGNRFDELQMQKGLINYGWGDAPPPGDVDGRSIDSYFYQKREIFAHEQEYRLAYQIAPNQAANISGQFVEVNLETLIERVYISPDGKPWLRELLEGITGEFNFEFTTSTVNDKPFPMDTVFLKTFPTQ